MRKKALKIVVAIVLCLSIGLTLAACNNGRKAPKSMGVSRPAPWGNADIQTTDSENLIEGAVITVSDNDADKPKLTDGDDKTSWNPKESIQSDYPAIVTVAFSEPTKINTVVLKEDGNFVQSFKLQRKEGNGWTDFYKQDKIEYYRYCTFDEIEVSEFRIVIDAVRSGRELNLSEIEVYNVAPKTLEKRFMVTNYYNCGDYDVDKNGMSEERAKYFDVITDQIMFEFVYFDIEGNIKFTQPIGDNGERPAASADDTYFRNALQVQRDAIGERDVNIVVSILSSLEGYLNIPNIQDKLIDNIVSFVEEYQIDGVDFDWEYPPTPDQWVNYGNLLIELQNKLNPLGKYVSVALSNFNVAFTKEQIKQINYVNIMGYDRFDIDGNHSSFRSGAYAPMQYFLNLGFQPSQLIAGMPVYGRPTTQEQIWTNYNDSRAVASNGGALGYWDNVQIIKGYEKVEGKPIDMPVYVNSPAMAADKTAYAIEQDFAGIMIFRMFIDCPYDDDRSVCRAVGNTISSRVGYAAA